MHRCLLLFLWLCWCTSALVPRYLSAWSTSSSISRRRSPSSRQCRRRSNAANGAAATDDLPPEVLAALSDTEAGPHGVAGVLRELLYACRVIGTSLRNGTYSALLTGTENVFGDKQLDVDVQADAVLFTALARCGLVHVAASEERPVEVDCGYQEQGTGTGYSVAFDPLDGSSIVDCNFAVGTIAGVWPGRGLLHRRGREQVASLMCVYGPKVSLALALGAAATRSGEALAVELTMDGARWAVTNKRFVISPKCKTFAPGNLRATADNPAYKALVSYWVDQQYTLRYSGGLVPDVYHILVKGQGVLSNASSRRAKAKLRLLFEAAPVALLVEAAGGASCVCATELLEQMAPVSVLDVEASDLDRRVGLCLGSADEVARFQSYLFGATPYKRYQYTIEDNTRYD